MAVSLTFHNNRVTDANGNPYVGAKLYVCEAGTTTLASIYSDEALSSPVANPLTSDAAGNFNRFYIAAGTYKLRAEDSTSTGIGTGILIREEDNIDTGVGTGGVVPIVSGGTGATSAASARTNLGAAAQTDVDDLASDISSLQSSLQNVVSVPQGRLTLTSGTPVINASVSAATSVYYTPYIGNLMPIWNGTQHIVFPFDELELVLDSNHVASTIYDVFAALDDGAPILVTGPAWNTSTAGSGARGTGAGTTEIERKGGLWTNKFAMTSARNGAETYSIDANKATYVGSIVIDGTNGQISCHVAYGQSRKWGVWNAYNRKSVFLKAGDSTASWTYSSATVRASNNSSSNSLAVFCGLPEEVIDLRFRQKINWTASTVTVRAQAGIGVNSTTTATGYNPTVTVSAPASSIVVEETIIAEHALAPGIGLNTITALEGGSTAAPTLYGTEQNMLLSAAYQA
jgi:hypothetical protein